MPMGRDAALRIARFAAVGLFNTLAYFVLANSLHYAFGMTAELASYAAYFIMVPVSFIGHKRVTFGTKGHALQELTKFSMLQAANLCVIAAANLATKTFNAPGWVAFALISIAIPAINFVVMQIWVFVVRR